MPDTDTGVKPEGSDDSTATAAPADQTGNTETSQVDTQGNAATDTTGTDFTDEDFDDIDEAHPIKPEDITSDENEDKDDDDEDEDPAKPEGDKPKDEAAEAGKAPDGTKPPEVETKPTGKEAREAKLKEEIKDLREGLGIEPNADIRSLVAERNSLRQLQEANIRKAGIDLERELLDMDNPETGEPYTPDEANRIARSATAEAESALAGQEARTITVQRNQATMERETLQAMQEFPIFMEKLPSGEPNPEYDQGLAELAGQHLMDAFVTEPVLDREGNPAKNEDGTPKTIVVNIKRSPYQIMKSVADQATRLQATREADKAEAEATAASRMAEQAAGADVPVSGNTSATKPNNTGQDFDDAFDEEV